MKSDRSRARLMCALGAAVLIGASLLLVLSPAEGLMLNAGGRAFAVGPLPPSKGTVGQLAPTRPPLLKPLPEQAGRIRSSAASWTFMVYLDADNDLEEYGIDDFLEMAQVGSDASVNVVVQFDRIDDYDGRYGDWTSTKRFYVSQGMTPTAANALSDLGEVNMGAPQSLIGFVNWAKTNYPATNYALVLWDHGSGWRLRRPRPPIRGVCYDETSDDDGLESDELHSALRSITNDGANPIHLLAFDACLMGMIEVDNQIKPFVNVRTGSEETEPGAGYPYDTILTSLVSTTDMSAATLGSEIVDKYYTYYYAALNNGQTHSAVDLGASYTALNSAVDSFAQTLTDHLGAHYFTYRAARAASQEFADASYVDLYDFAEEVKTRVTETALVSAATSVMNAVTNAMINEQHGEGWPGAHGISIYFPTSSIDWSSNYPGSAGFLIFTQQSRWDEFLQAHLAHGVGLSPATQWGLEAAGSTMIYLQEIQNTGLDNDSYDLALSGNMWPTTIWDETFTNQITNTGIVTSTDYAYIVLQVQIPGGAGPGDFDTAILRTTSVTRPDISATVPFTTAVLGGDILLVDDDGDCYGLTDAGPHYRSALAHNGYPYDCWDVCSVWSSPDLAALQQYEAVIWFTGEDYEEPLLPPDEDALASYLDGGGTLFLSAQDYLYNVGLTPFGQNYLHISSHYDDMGASTITGGAGNPVGDGLGPYALRYPFDDYSDEVAPDEVSSAIFTNDYGNPCALSASGSFKTVFFAFPFEALQSADADVVMNRIVSWLHPGAPTTPTPTATHTPTPTPTITPDAIGYKVYLPICLKDYDPSAPTPTPTNTPTRTSTFTPTPSPTTTSAVTPTSTPTPTLPPTEVHILENHSFYVDILGYLNIVGEVKNDTADHFRLCRDHCQCVQQRWSVH